MESLNLFEALDEKESRINISISLSISYSLNSENQQAIELLKKALTISEKLKSKYYIALTNLYFACLKFGRDKSDLKHYSKSLTLFEELESKKDIAWINFHIGVFLVEITGEFDLALEHYNKSLDIFQEMQYQRGIATTLLRIGHANRLKGYYNQALDFYRKGLMLHKELDNKSGIARAILTIGQIYQDRGELDRALEHYQMGLELAEKGYSELGGYCLLFIDSIMRVKGEFDTALEYFKKALRGAKYSLFFTQILYQLIAISIETNSMQDAQRYLNQLQEFDQKMSSEVINQYYRLAKALTLTQSKRLGAKVQALEMFHQIAEEETTRHELTIEALLNLCELLLFELRTTEDDSILVELEIFTKRLIEIALIHNSFSLLAEAYLLQHKLALVALDIQKAEKLFTQARVIAEEKGLQQISIRIFEEEKSLVSKLGSWGELSKKKSTMAERIDYIQIEKNIQRMKRERSDEILGEKGE